jgi:hypothetical protein
MRAVEGKEYLNFVFNVGVFKNKLVLCLGIGVGWC